MGMAVRELLPSDLARLSLCSRDSIKRLQIEEMRLQWAHGGFRPLLLRPWQSSYVWHLMSELLPFYHRQLDRKLKKKKRRWGCEGWEKQQLNTFFSSSYRLQAWGSDWMWPHSYFLYIHFFNKQLLSTYRVSGTLWGFGDTVVNKEKKVLPYRQLTFE